jgi:hypothetical protein
MKDKDKGLFLIGLVVVVALLLFAFLFSVREPFAVTSGVSLLSVSAPNVVSDDADLRNFNWLVLTRLGGGDRISFMLSPADFERSTGVSSDRSFTATANSISETVEYNINLQPDFTIFRYGVTPIISLSEPCPSGTFLDLRWKPILGSGSHFCVVEIYDGQYGTLSQPTIKFEAELSVSNGQMVIKEMISSDVTSVSFRRDGQTFATASWQGSLVTGNPPPDVPGIAVVTTHSNDEWRFVTTTGFAQYRSAQNSFLDDIDSLAKRSITTSGGLSSMRDDMIKELDQLEATRSATIRNYQSISSSFNLVNKNSLSGAKLVFNPEVRLTNPVVTWWIRADWLGVERLVTKPVILRVDGAEFGNSEQGEIRVTVRNDGKASGVVNAYLSKCTQFKQTYTALEYSLGAGATRVLPVYVDAGSVNRNLEESCTVCVRDVNNPSVEVCSLASVRFFAARVCTPGQYSVDSVSNSIMLCTSDGLGLVKVADCGLQGRSFSAEYTGVGEFGGYECVDRTKSVVVVDPGVDRESFVPVALIVGLVLGLFGAVTVFVFTGGLRGRPVFVVFRWLLVVGVFVALFVLTAVVVRWAVALFSFWV